MLTIKDLDEIEELIKKHINEALGHLPSKDEFFGKMDELMGEL